MQVVDLNIGSIFPAPWTPNEMDSTMLAHLRHSIQRFGVVVPLVVRETEEGVFETIGGAQRLAVLTELEVDLIPCDVVQADDAEARLLGQALNHIAGSDNLGLRAQVLREVLESRSPEEVLQLLPETAASLQSLISIGQESLVQALRHWEQVQQARLRHLSFQLTDEQLQVVEEVLGLLLSESAGSDQGPNHRGVALYRLCQRYLDQGPL